jgi:glycosyltransferase involved in cell wall biosynthesis
MSFERRPAVSVIMNCLNGEKFVRSAIESVYSQTFEDWEIIFLDNASTDNTAKIATSYDSKLRYFLNDNTVPLGQARNQALDKARGDFIAFLDSDDIWFPEKLERQIPLFLKDDKVGIVFSDAILINEEYKGRNSYFQRHNYYPPRGNIFRNLLIHYSIPLLTAVIRTKALDTLSQWFDDKYSVCSDFDFFIRLAYNWHCNYINIPLAQCLIHKNAVTFKMHNSAPDEMLGTLEKLKIYDPNFQIHYRIEISILLDQIMFMRGKSYWRLGDSSSARSIFKSRIFVPKFAIAYLCTIISFDTFDRLVRLFR